MIPHKEDLEKKAEKYLSDIESLILFSPDTPNEMLYEAKKKELIELLTSLTPKPTTADDVNKLYDLVKVQVNDPSSKTDPYMRGKANGLICALAVFKKWNPIYIDAPKQSVPQPTKEDGEVMAWEKEFDELFDVQEYTFNDDMDREFRCNDDNADNIKYFIRNLLASTRKDALEQVATICDDHECLYDNCACYDLAKSIRSLIEREGRA